MEGKAVAQQIVIAGREQARVALPEVQARTDSDGVVRFALGVAGKWYVKFIHMKPITGDNVDYESKWARLTFEVR